MRWDPTVYPNTRIARMPRRLRPLALLARNVLPASLRPHRYAYRSTDLATSNHSPFLEDPMFAQAWERVATHWYEGEADIRWRLWILSRLARTRRADLSRSPASVAEFGVYRGGCAFVILSTAELPASQRYFLFDTFAGLPEDHLVESEQRMGMAGEWSDTSVEAVNELLAKWSAQIEIRAGDIFDVLKVTETGPLSFVHVDLNASAPTIRALEYAYERMVPGAIIVFDDYGSPRYMEQRRGIDAFFAAVPEDVVALPTGQAFAVKSGA